ncbi:uncharacterized protein ACBR49_016279 [Aulostomus maculatus]
MADFMTSDLPVRGGGAAGKGTMPSVTTGNRNWEVAGGLDQITVVRIDDTHIAEEQSQEGGRPKQEAADYYEVEYSMPAQEEVVGEEEEDSVFVIEYSNPEEEGESYQFMMSVDRSLPTKKSSPDPPVTTDAATSLPAMLKPSRPLQRKQQVRQKRKLVPEEEEVKKEEEAFVSNKSVLELGEDYNDVMKRKEGSGKGQLVCTLCPPPGRSFKRASGLAVHLKQIHLMEEKKTFFCMSCKQACRSQIELDAHTRRHATQEAVFTCHLCTAEAEKTGYQGSKWGLRKHLEREHPGVIPHCHVCNKSFKSLPSYLADQFRHVGVSPYFCAKCKIYEMTERGLKVHTQNHDKKKKAEVKEVQQLPGADNSATDDSDF